MMWELRPLDDVVAQLRQEFPTCGDIEPLTVLGQGFSSLAVESADGYVFLIARNGDPKYASAITFLEQVGDQLPVTVPKPEFAKPHILGYPKLEGISLEDNLDSINQDQLALDVAQFMVTLHSLTPPMDLPTITWQESVQIYTKRRDDTSNIIRELMTPEEATTIDEWWESFLTDDRMAMYQPVVVHGDLWYGNMLADSQGELTAVIDWENVAITDPAYDFVPQIYLGESFDRSVREAYQQKVGIIDSHLLHRVEQLRIVREFSGLQMAIALKDSEEITESIDKIRMSPLFS
jgi:aminoglycoside 2''-phosphotransferase